MSFQHPYKGQNFIGVHVDSAAATAWVLSEKWDTTHNGYGTPQDGMIYFDSTAQTLFCWSNGAWNMLGGGGGPAYGVYVDQINGSDVTGDGTIGKPYASLSYACLQQPDPDPVTGIDVFLTPILFYVGPGIYIDDVTYPQRIGVIVHGENCVLSGTHSWNIKPSWWTAFSLDTGITPFMVFEGATRTSDIRSTAIPGGTEARQFLLQNGLLKIENKEPTIATVPDYHTLIVNNVLRDGFKIWNAPGASLLTDYGLGTLYLFMNNARCLSAEGNVSYIAGEADRVEDGMGGGIFYPNCVRVWAEDSDVHVAGVCQINKLIHCSYSANWQIDHEGNPYAYGWIGGDAGNKYGERVQVVDSSMRSESFFGYGYKATQPRHSDSPAAIVFDRASIASLANKTTDFSASFYGFDAYDMCAFGRGWFFEDDDIDLCGVLRIPHVGSEDRNSTKLFVHTLGSLSSWMANGNALASGNRLQIYVEAGEYLFEDMYVSFSTEFVDVFGAFRIREKVKYAPNNMSASRNGTIFHFTQTAGALWEIENGGLSGIWMERDWSSAPPAEDILKFTVEGNQSKFSNLWFAPGYGYTGWIPNAVGQSFSSSGMKIMGKWEDCGASVNGLFHECSINGTFVRCYAKDNSFAGGTANALDGFNTCEGYFEDCYAGDYSFGNTSGGGAASFLAARAVRCRGRRFCFGATYNGGDATFNAYAEDCSAYAQSFGAAIGTGNGAAICAGKLINCRLAGKTEEIGGGLI